MNAQIRPSPGIFTSAEDQILNYLSILYDEAEVGPVWRQIKKLVDDFLDPHHPQSKPAEPLSEKDVVLITYGDSLIAGGKPPLKVLSQFASRWLAGVVSGIHILPFFPYSSDDGFSVIDYRNVNPDLGSWADITGLGLDYRLMVDMVINHVSQYSDWFQAYLRDEPPYNNYFITAQPDWDLSSVVRPRTLPLTTEFNTSSGPRQVWTTFSEDQIDLNYANPAVLLETIAVLLDYVAHGAGIIRLDAIAYLWKEPGTSCIHHPKTHLVVKILRRVLDLAAPHVIIITETNVPHIENISYFGNHDLETGRTDEAQLVYQFPLAPLILHSFYTQDAARLSTWAASLDGPGMFFNFIASHDGIGVRPVRDLLTEAEVQLLADRVMDHGGRVSCKSDAGGVQIPYELNITLYDALNDPNHPNLQTDSSRFLAAQVIMLSLAGVPGIYIHSLFGSRNCHACVQESGRARSINREKFDYDILANELEHGESPRARLFESYRHLLGIRRLQPAFHPQGEQKVLFLDTSLFALVRTAPGFLSGDRRADVVLALVNVSAAPITCHLDLELYNLAQDREWQDLISGDIFRPVESCLDLVLAPYQYCWLKPKPEKQ